jgi:hypothetical protein
MVFAVPKGSTANSISAEAAYVVEGWAGGQYKLAPWTDPTQVYVRDNLSGTERMIGVAIGLVADSWAIQKGAPHSYSKAGDLVSALAAPGNTSAAIGILSTGDADNHRDTLKILAYQHKGQQCGYLPDSSSSSGQSRDKINVRQGRYAIWGQVHIVTNTDGNGHPIPDSHNPAGNYVQTVINYLTSNPSLTLDERTSIIDVEAQANVVPDCAMQVSRTAEIGPEASYQPTIPCGCYFESKVGGASPSCKACTDDTGCSGGTPKCRYNYCEAQ